MKHLTMKQQIELEMAKAEKIRQICIDFQKEMAEIDKRQKEMKMAGEI